MSLAESMYENGDLESAQRVFAQIITSAKSAGDAGAEAEALAFSGDIAYQKGRMDEGKTDTTQALALSRKSGVAPSVRVWSEIYYAANTEKNGFLSDANLQLMQQAVQECHQYNLPERETAYATYQLAEDFEARGRLDEAAKLIQQDIDIYNSEPYAICDQSQMYEDLAYLNVSRDQVGAAIPQFQRAYDGLKSCSGPEKKNTLMVQSLLAGAMTKVGQSKEAIPILEGSLPAWRRISGNSPDMFPPLYYLSRAYSDVGRYQEGETLAKELLGILEGKVSPKDRRLGATNMAWALALAGQHRYQEALPHAELAAKLTTSGQTPYTRRLGAEAQQVLTDIKAKAQQNPGK